ncbi:MAG TPA: patatin-like phospholipase family protein [Geminicoccaceae bacterium]|nr:patatin-like phospholipase family protein [Geminicoccaceae bacterium]
MPDAPVEPIPGDESRAPEPGAGLCLSGGGYRAMVFHVGVLWRLYEAGLLGGVKRVSSVSGGSITAGLLALKWPKLSFDPKRLQADFVPEIVTPIRTLARETIDAEAIILGLALPGRVSERVVAAYEEHLYGKATLQDLPDEPRFVINATNVQSGAIWRFMKPYMRDWRVGEVKRPTVPLARAVAASSAFPPVLSPVEMRLDPNSFTPGTGQDLQRPPFTSKVILSDGGVYDNLGLETVWKRYRTVYVSDAGGKLQAEEEPKSDWARHSYRVLALIDNQVRALRKRQVIDSFKARESDAVHRGGAYWGIRTDIADYGLADPLPCPLARTTELAETPTRLKRLDGERQERLINWGYAVCDAALRRHVDPKIPKPGGFPYPAAKV